jgi:hypothetical protein
LHKLLILREVECATVEDHSDSRAFRRVSSIVAAVSLAGLIFGASTVAASSFPGRNGLITVTETWDYLGAGGQGSRLFVVRPDGSADTGSLVSSQAAVASVGARTADGQPTGK